MAEMMRTDVAATATTEADPVSKVVYVGPSISWRGIFAGAFVGLLFFFALGALGMALGGIGLKSIIQHGGSSVGLSVGAGIWLLISCIVSLFAGGYVAGRASGVLPTRIGAIEGLVVSGMLFLLIFAGLGTSASVLGSAAGSVVGTAASTAGSLATNAQVQNALGQTVSGLNLKSSSAVVVQGIAARLLAGDEQSAADYLAYQAGITRDEARARLDRVKTQVAGTARDVGRMAATATQALGWTLFLSILLGSGFALFGGAVGVRRNIRHPLSESDRRVAMEARPEWYGYAYGGPPTRPVPQSP